MSPISSFNSSISNSTLALSGLVSDEEYRLCILVIVPLSLVMGVVGTLGNIANIVIYVRMGFADSTNVSLTALACSDLGGALMAMLAQSFYLPVFDHVPIVPHYFILTIGSYPHIVFTRTSGVITAFISLERYLCVFIPLKIKRIFTPRRTCIVMVCIFVAVVPPMLNIYFKYPHTWRFFPELNHSLLTIISVDDTLTEMVFTIFQVYISIILPISSFLVVTFCTLLLTISLNRSKKWRDSNRTVSSNQHGQTGSADATKAKTNKETRIVKMVVAVATVFIISTIPSCVHIIIVMLFPQFDINGRYGNIFNVTGNAFFVIDLINCSVNIIIYFRMSTKFRQTAIELFKGFPKCCKEKKTKITK